MSIRSVYLSTEKRIAEIKELYRVTLPKSLLGQQLIHIEDHKTHLPVQIINELTSNPTIQMFMNPDQSQAFIAITSTSKFSKEARKALPFLDNLISPCLLEPWVIRDQVLDFTDTPIIMGILNVTPDSFSDGGKFTSVDMAIKHALRMESDGARIIDVGGESSRPGSDPVPVEEEIKRVVPVIQAIRQQSKVLISIDTTKSLVAKSALEAGADIVNDISAMQFDPEMAPLVRAVDCPVVIMHMQGTPKSMQLNPTYKDVQAELFRFFQHRLALLRENDIYKIALDPGIGFGKRLQDNLNILRDLKDLKGFKLPVLVGSSRKSFIGTVLDRTIDKRLSGTIATHIFAMLQGASILRVHDVPETMDAIKMYRAINQS